MIRDLLRLSTSSYSQVRLVQILWVCPPLTQFVTLNLKYPHFEEGIVREFGNVMYTLLYLKWVTNKDLL